MGGTPSTLASHGWNPLNSCNSNTLQQQSANGRIVITTVHNPAMAMRYANQILLLYGDGAWEYGPAEQLLEPQRLQRVYQTPFDYYRSDSSKQKVLLPA